MKLSEYTGYDALGFAELVRSGEVHPRELVDATVAAIDAVNPELNAVIATHAELAHEMADGAAPNSAVPDAPFRGVPFLLKDLFVPLAGVRLTNGSRFFRDHVPREDHELVVRYRRAGLVFCGKTNTPELGLMPTTEPELHGPTHNPWKRGHSSGGSSGGAAAAVAAGIVPLAHASDGGGSIRIPASCCGVFGFKPTRATTPCGPDTSEQWHGFAINHAVSRTVRDNAALLDASRGPEITSPYHPPTLERPLLEEVGAKVEKLRIAWCVDPWLPSTVHPDCKRATEDAAKLCEELGHEVEEAAPAIDPRAFARAFFTVVCCETAATLLRTRTTMGRVPEAGEMEASTMLTAMLGHQMSGAEMCVAVKELQDLSRKAARFFQRYDVLLSPTLAKPPLPHGSLHPQGLEARLQELVARRRLTPLLKIKPMIDRALDRVYDFIPFTPLGNVAGLPSMSVPLYWNSDRLPIGAMFTGPFGSDSRLFRLAAQLEEARPWKDRRPPVFVS
jgi:amidase